MIKKNKFNPPFNTNDTSSKYARQLSESAKKDIEKSYNLDNAKTTEAYYSNRYGWTLRKTLV